jgi:uncharacterized protein (DUF427 family)
MGAFPPYGKDMKRIPRWLERARAHWEFTGQHRPPFAVAPKEGQESVWDYPRPPRLAADEREVVVRAADAELARTRRSVRVLETASPPTFYLPRSDVDDRLVEPAAGGSMCEWKGAASYWTVVANGTRLERVAWSYEEPFEPFAEIAGYLSFYPAHVECYVNGERVRPQPGSFYGGWVTEEVVGPFKGEPGSTGW